MAISPVNAGLSFTDDSTVNNFATGDLFPIVTNTYSVGNYPTPKYHAGYFQNVYTNAIYATTSNLVGSGGIDITGAAASIDTTWLIQFIHDNQVTQQEETIVPGPGILVTTPNTSNAIPGSQLLVDTAWLLNYLETNQGLINVAISSVTGGIIINGSSATTYPYQTDTTLNQQYVNAIVQNYSLYLGRIPAESEFEFWYALLIAGTTVTLSNLSTYFTGSPEYLADKQAGKIDSNGYYIYGANLQVANGISTNVHTFNKLEDATSIIVVLTVEVSMYDCIASIQPIFSGPPGSNVTQYNLPPQSFGTVISGFSYVDSGEMVFMTKLTPTTTISLPTGSYTVTLQSYITDPAGSSANCTIGLSKLVTYELNPFTAS